VPLDLLQLSLEVGRPLDERVALRLQGPYPICFAFSRSLGPQDGLGTALCFLDVQLSVRLRNYYTVPTVALLLSRARCVVGSEFHRVEKTKLLHHVETFATAPRQKPP